MACNTMRLNMKSMCGAGGVVRKGTAFDRDWVVVQGGGRPSPGPSPDGLWALPEVLKHLKLLFIDDCAWAQAGPGRMGIPGQASGSFPGTPPRPDQHHTPPSVSSPSEDPPVQFSFIHQTSTFFRPTRVKPAAPAPQRPPRTTPGPLLFCVTCIHPYLFQRFPALPTFPNATGAAPAAAVECTPPGSAAPSHHAALSRVGDHHGHH